MPSKGKAKNAPNDKRHENNSGLAPPVGRRISRQRSLGQLNGQPNGKTPASTTQPPPLPSTGLNAGYRWPRPADSSTDPTSSAAARDHAAALEGAERDRTPSDVFGEEIGPFGEMGMDIGQELSVSGTADTAAYKTSSRHAPGTLSAVSTILTYYPLRDAISILILLLSLPPTLVLVIQALFASLTFVPPTAGLSLSTLPNVKEMFSSPNFGYPAMATIFIVDIGVYLIWLAFRRPMQAIFLDLSQAVIAVSLSGAAASTGGPTYSTATCSLIVCVVHVLRYKAIHLTALDYLRSVLHKWSGGISFDAPLFSTTYLSTTPTERGLIFTAVRTILGIHIVSQGVTTCIRRNLANAKANEIDQTVPAITKTDTEATAGSELYMRSGPGASLQPSHASSSTDGRSPGQPPSHRDARNRESSNKKKRKQANQVRSQQPLWAAIASTKVTFVKEMEQRDAADDAREAVVKDNDITQSIVSTANAMTDRIWLYDVRDTGVHLAVDLSAETIQSMNLKDELSAVPAGIDKSKPFFIRVNRAAWSSTRIVFDGESQKGVGGRYLGEIFGLAPRSSYHVEIVSLAKQVVLCSTSLITQPAPTAEQAAAAPVPSQTSALRPSSPITTLKQSIQSAEAKLNEIRNRAKKSKKDQRAAQADIKREINLLRGKLESSGGVDDKQERRLLQISQHKNQAEEATAELKTQVEALGEIPRDELAASEVKRRAWQSALDAKKAAEQDFEEARAEQDRELTALKAEISVSETKRERLASRNTQRTQELEKLSAKHQAEMTAKQKRDQERALELHKRQQHEYEIRFQTAQTGDEATRWLQKAHDLWQQANALVSYATQPPPGFPEQSSPPPPEGVLPASNGQISPHANEFAAGTFHPPPFGSPFTTQATLNNFNPTAGPRGRSSSMLSQYSGFTDTAEEYAFAHTESRPHPTPTTWPVHTNASAGATFESRKASDGGDNASSSGSASVSGGTSMVNGSTNGSNSPRPEAKPFVPKSVGTIGPPGKKAVVPPPQSPTKASVLPGVLRNGR